MRVAGRRVLRGWMRGLGAMLVVGLLAGLQAPVAASEVRRPVIGLVLSGGGALGATHIGVLKVLEELKVPVDIITGTSMGSIVGGLYALGLDAQELESLVASIDWAKTFEDSPPRGSLPVRRKQEDYGFLLDLKLGIKDGGLQLPAGLIQGQRLTLMLRELTVRAHDIGDFDNLPIRYRAVAADLETGKQVILGGGNLATAMRASMSVPAFLPPVEVDGRLLVDGGVANNLPVDVARAMGAEVLIVVDIPTVLKKRDQLTSSLDIAGQMLAVLIQQNSLAQIASLGPQDILIQPDLGDRGSVDFDAILEMIAPGEAAARAQTARLQALSLAPAAYADDRRSRGVKRVESPVIAFVDIDNRTKLDDRRIRASIRQKVGEPLNVKQIEEDFSQLYGSGLYEQVDYALVDREGKTGLVVTATGKAWAQDYIRLGLALESDVDGESSYEVGFGLTLTALNSYGAEARGELAFGDAQYLLGEFYQPLQPGTGFYVLPAAAYVRNDARARGNDGTTSEFRTTRAEAALYLGYEFGTELDTRVGLRVGAGEVDLHTGTGAGDETGDFRIGAAEARLLYDTLDSVRFPTGGSLLRLQAGASRTELGADDNYVRLDATAVRALTWGSNTLVLGSSGGTAASGNLPVYDRFRVGGLFSLSGYARDELSTGNLLLGRVLLMRRLSRRSPLFFDLPVYAGTSFEAARLDDASGEDEFDKNAFGGSLFLGADTPLGAGYLALGKGDAGRTAGYLYFGKLF
ncbi:patatin-like phospholipase family protein [Thalassobaculum sp.]|uniref:patatin-like phospholipase family protein n=1 Tax=Thalassobaculum sp. TaxID=2022740 RepID=UPI0032EEFF4E